MGSEDNDFWISRTAMKSIAIFLIIVGIIFLPISSSIESYNNLVYSDVTCSQAKADVQTALEQRADLIPNIINTIKGSSRFEKTTLIDVVQERSKAFQLKSDAQSAITESQLQTTENSIDSTIGRLLLIAEQYPTIKTTDQYLQLQNKLQDTENIIRANRMNYNHAVRNYQQLTRSFPTNIFAGIFGFNTDKWKSFEVYPEKDQVPNVQFDL